MVGKKPLKTHGNLNYTNNIKSGIYLLDKDFCKKTVNLVSNNKTDTMIKNVFYMGYYKTLSKMIFSLSSLLQIKF